MRLATEKQKLFMDELGIDYDKDISLEEASLYISNELEHLNELEAEYNSESYGDR